MITEHKPWATAQLKPSPHLPISNSNWQRQNKHFRSLNSTSSASAFLTSKQLNNSCSPPTLTLSPPLLTRFSSSYDMKDPQNKTVILSPWICCKWMDSFTTLSPSGPQLFPDASVAPTSTTGPCKRSLNPNEVRSALEKTVALLVFAECLAQPQDDGKVKPSKFLSRWFALSTLDHSCSWGCWGKRHRISSQQWVI